MDGPARTKSGLLMSAGVLAAAVSGCAKPAPAPVGQVAQAWESPPSGQQAVVIRPVRPAGPPAETPAPASEPIATINGVAIPRKEFVDLLLEGHGLATLEALIVLEAARQQARSLGIELTQADIDAEYERQLIELSSPVGSATPTLPDRDVGERLLEQILARRNMSRREYMLLTERNAYLRKIAASQVKVTDDMLPAEYEKAYGEKVQIRHIQLASRSELTRVQSLLDSGEDFARLARQYSHNPLTRSKGGLLPPFARGDEVPKALQEAAFALKPGQISAPIFEDNWYHIIKLERRFPPSNVPLEHVADQLRRRLRDRLIRKRMDELAQKLFREAVVRIRDPVLRRQFQEKYPSGRTGAGPG